MVGVVAGGTLMTASEHETGKHVEASRRAYGRLRRAARRPPLMSRVATRLSLVAGGLLCVAGLGRDAIDRAAARVAIHVLHLTPALAEVLPRWAPRCEEQVPAGGEAARRAMKVGGSGRRPRSDPHVYLLRQSVNGRLVADYFDGRAAWCGRLETSAPDEGAFPLFAERIENGPGMLFTTPEGGDDPLWVCVSVSPTGNELHFAARCESMTWALAGADGFQLRAAGSGRAAYAEFGYDADSRTYRERAAPAGPAGGDGAPRLRFAPWDPPGGRSVRFPASKPLTEVLHEVLPRQVGQTLRGVTRPSAGRRGVRARAGRSGRSFRRCSRRRRGPDPARRRARRSGGA